MKSFKKLYYLTEQDQSIPPIYERMQKLTDILTIFVCDNVLVKFKREKLGLYNRILSSYQVIEISNAHAVSGFWATLRNPFQRIIVVDALGEKNNLPISLSVISN